MTDGFCTCYPEGPARDCGITTHRAEAERLHAEAAR